MKSRIYLSLLGAILLISSLAFSQQTNKAENLYQEALMQMEGRGNYSKALEIFGQIIKDFPGSRQTCARSQFKIGVCYEKLGKSEAQKAYERVIKDFADQGDVVAEARGRLDALENASQSKKVPELTLRKLEYAQLNTPFARLSPDGKKIAYVVYTGGSPKRIDILDLNSGTVKVLVDSFAGGQPSLVWSPRSDKIAYTFRGKELHVRDIDGTHSHVLLKDTVNQIYPTDWSRDGKRILCFFEGDDWTLRIGTVTSDGQAQFLASGNSIEFRSEPKLSPDGGYVACSLGEHEGNTDIYVWTSDGSRKVRVTEHPGRDENPVWSPDGKYLAFLSDRNRSVDLWGVQMQGGATVGAQFVIKRDLGWRTRISDFTASGKLFLLMLGGAEPSNLFTIPVNQESGSLGGTIAPISVYPTDHFFPRYSPNGKMQAYLSRRGQMGWPKLFVLDAKGSERELPLRGHYAVNVAWHPGNRSLFFAGWDKTYKAGIYELSLEKDEIRCVYSGERIELKTYKGGLVNINLLPDAKKIMFFRLLEKGDLEVLTCEPDGQHPSVVLSRVNMPVWGSPSPTGENICYRIGDSLMLVSVSNGASKLIGSSTLDLEATWAPHGESLMFREESRLRIFSLKENASRTAYQAPAGRTIGGMEMYATAWSPNGSCVIFTERDTSASSTSPQKLFLINPGDGSLKTAGEAPEGYRLSELRWSPDGSKVVTTGKSTRSARAPMYEYWVMENVLPKEVRQKQ
jgi:Tol biopolymer transport system component